jgi:glucose-1-phosphate adenylyltransferase
MLPDRFFISLVPAQMRVCDTWFQGSADAVYQNLHLIKQFKPDIVAVFGADHIYRMDIRQMVEFHLEKAAEVTVAAYPVPVQDASAFGILEVDPQGRILSFREKPAYGQPMPGDPDYCLGSMGNYLFNTETLIERLDLDAISQGTRHDFGGDIIPNLIHDTPAYAYDFRYNRIPGEKADQHPYWRDVGTLEAYYDANMDLRKTKPELNLYNPRWPIYAGSSIFPAAKFTFNEEGRRGLALQSLISEGCIVSGGTVIDSILGRNVFVHSYSEVEASVIMDNCHIHRNVRIRRAIIDKNVQVPEGEEIGYDAKQDQKRFTTTDSGLVVIPRDYVFESGPGEH